MNCFEKLKRKNKQAIKIDQSQVIILAVLLRCFQRVPFHFFLEFQLVQLDTALLLVIQGIVLLDHALLQYSTHYPAFFKPKIQWKAKSAAKTKHLQDYEYNYFGWSARDIAKQSSLFCISYLFE